MSGNNCKIYLVLRKTEAVSHLTLTVCFDDLSEGQLYATTLLHVVDKKLL